MRPARSILDPAFIYRPSHATDVRATFERVRRELERPRAPRPDSAAGDPVIVPIKRAR